MNSLNNTDLLSWKENGLEFTEIISQPYSNCKFSAGFVKGHPIDNLYLQAQKHGKVTTQIIMRPDEMAAIAWIANGVLWSYEINKVE